MGDRQEKEQLQYSLVFNHGKYVQSVINHRVAIDLTLRDHRILPRSYLSYKLKDTLHFDRQKRQGGKLLIEFILCTKVQRYDERIPTTFQDQLVSYNMTV